MSNSIIYIPKLNPKAKMQLLCIPYAGGSTRDFYDWIPRFPDIEFGLIAYPGRGHRISEKPILDINEMLQTIFDECKKVITKEFAIFGHSMGSILSYGLAKRLEQSNFVAKCLFVSAAAAPTRYINESNTLSLLPDDEFIRVLVERYSAIPKQILKDKELIKMFVKIMRADISLEEQYIKKCTVETCNPISSDIAAFGGLDDTAVTDHALSTWSPLTTGSFSKKMFPGTHFYLKEYPELLFKEISNILDI